MSIYAASHAEQLQAEARSMLGLIESLRVQLRDATNEKERYRQDLERLAVECNTARFQAERYRSTDYLNEL